MHKTQEHHYASIFLVFAGRANQGTLAKVAQLIIRLIRWSFGGGGGCSFGGGGGCSIGGEARQGVEPLFVAC